jgi:hypothetical protein
MIVFYCNILEDSSGLAPLAALSLVPKDISEFSQKNLKYAV